MRAHLDDEQPELLDEPSFLYLGIQVALLLLVFSLWVATDADLLAASSAEAAWDAAIAAPIDRTTALVADSREIVLRRSVCFGWCPVYEVRIGAAGSVRFRGERYVCAFGDRTTTVDPYAVRHLLHALDLVPFDQLSVGPLIPDAPVTTLSIRDGNDERTLRFQEGLAQNVDDVLTEMAERVDQLADTHRWLPIRMEIYGYCLNDDGTFSRARESAIDRERPRTSGTVRFR
jgi:hypothetical protein